MGIPFFWEEKGPLLSQKEYLEQLVMCNLEKNRFIDMQHALFGKNIIDKLAREFELLYDFKATCAIVPNFLYIENMQLRVLAHDMVVVNFPGLDQWRSIEQYGSNKFRLQY